MNLRKIIKEEIEKLFEEDIELTSEGFFSKIFSPGKKEITKYTIGGTGQMNKPTFNIPSYDRYSSYSSNLKTNSSNKPNKPGKKIKKEVSNIFQEEDATNDAIGGTIQDIGAMMQQDIEKMSDIIKTQQTSLKNDEAAYKQDVQKKNALSPRIGDVDNAEKKGLERSLPLKDQLNKSKEKQIKDLENTKKAMETAKKDLEKKNLELAQQAKQAETKGKSEKSSSADVLPSLESPI